MGRAYRLLEFPVKWWCGQLVFLLGTLNVIFKTFFSRVFQILPGVTNLADGILELDWQGRKTDLSLIILCFVFSVISFIPPLPVPGIFRFRDSVFQFDSTCVSCKDRIVLVFWLHWLTGSRGRKGGLSEPGRSSTLFIVFQIVFLHLVSYFILLSTMSVISNSRNILRFFGVDLSFH